MSLHFVLDKIPEPNDPHEDKDRKDDSHKVKYGKKDDSGDISEETDRKEKNANSDDHVDEVDTTKKTLDTCEDSSLAREMCGTWKSRGFCDSREKIREQYCRKTCETCKFEGKYQKSGRGFDLPV